MARLKVMLDTNILIYIHKSSPQEVIARLRKFKRGEVAVSSVVWAEFSVGLYKNGIDAPSIEKLIDVLVFDKKAAGVFGRISANKPGRQKGFDRLIAAHAIALGVPLVTNNVADFQPYLEEGLVVENWA